MISFVFLAGILLFTLSSLYFYLTGEKEGKLNSAFLVSFVTLISYILMWQGKLTVVTETGQTIYWSRWLFYALSCSLLMLEIAQLKKIKGGALVQLLYLTVLVMFTGYLTAVDLTGVRWVFFIISSVAYSLLVNKVLKVKSPGSGWVHNYIFFGWSVFPIAFLLAPTGIGLFGASLANLIYLLLDFYTKIVFNLQLAGKTQA